LSTKVLTPCAEPALLRDRPVDPDSLVSDDRGRCATASPPDDAALAALSATLVLCNLSPTPEALNFRFQCCLLRGDFGQV